MIDMTILEELNNDLTTTWYVLVGPEVSQNLRSILDRFDKLVKNLVLIGINYS